MNSHTVIFVALLSVASIVEAVAPDVRTERQLATSLAHARETTLQYDKHRNGTAHAVADLAYCQFNEHLAAARARGFNVAHMEPQHSGLSVLREKVRLPAVLCNNKSLSFHLNADRPAPSAPRRT